MSEFDKMVEWLDAAWPARSCIVPCLLGSPGIGKTAAVQQHAKNVAANKVVTIIASQILPNEVSGITMPVAERHAMEIYDHYRLSTLEDNDVLFFDELLEGDQLVLSACLTLIESRMLMSGRKLPNIQVIAATNATIKPSQLKLNIRQRFVWCDFHYDPDGCAKYIEKTYGFKIDKAVKDLIVETGEGYNVFTMRSCTKMAAWMASAHNKTEANKIANAINKVWNNQVGSLLYHSWCSVHGNDEYDVASAIKSALEETGNSTLLSDDDFQTLSISEIIELLQGLEDWDAIALSLKTMEVEEEEVSF